MVPGLERAGVWYPHELSVWLGGCPKDLSQSREAQTGLLYLCLHSTVNPRILSTINPRILSSLTKPDVNALPLENGNEIRAWKTALSITETRLQRDLL